MDSTDARYHDDWRAAVETSAAQTWPQHQLAATKKHLTEAAQHTIIACRDRFDSTRDQFLHHLNEL